MELKYPAIVRRYLATLIDGIIIIVIFLAVSFVFQRDNNVSVAVRIGIFIIMFFIYEPICTIKLCTIGQKIMSVRVRSRITLKNISIAAAYVRIIIKILLGIISFVTIPVSKEKRGIHDFAAHSIVIEAKT